ncbi:hypothetical protein VPH35_015880 [Triticum aestivum]
MARKRHRDRDGTVDSARKPANPADDSAESSPEFAKPVYLVAERLFHRTPYSLLMVDAAAGGGHKAPPARNLGAFPGAKRGMSFVAAHSKHGSWIVGVGGRRGYTVIYDPSTQAQLSGPDLRCPKHENPSSSPTEASSLPPPPFFPCSLRPEEFRSPPDITVSSYAAVGPYILISLEQQDQGTCAFHVVEKTWEKVSDKGLPFVGQAVPLGGSLFAGCSVISKTGPLPGDSPVSPAASVFHMSIKASSTPSAPPELTATLLSIQELAGELLWEIPRLFFCPLGKGSFCSIRKGIICEYYGRESKCVVDMPIILSTFHVDDIEAILAACQTERGEAQDLQVAVQVKQHDRTDKIKARARWLPGMPVVAALSM